MWQQWYKAQQVMMMKMNHRKYGQWRCWISDSDISMTLMNGPEQVSKDYKKFLYARATHSIHAIQYHMQQIIERQKVVNEYIEA